MASSVVTVGVGAGKLRCQRERWLLLLALLLNVILTGCAAQRVTQAEVDCTAPLSRNLELAISQLMSTVDSGCRSQFFPLFDRLLVVAEGDPGKSNKSKISQYLEWSVQQGIIGSLQAKETYTRYFGVKFVSLLDDRSLCAASCPRRTDLVTTLQQELQDKDRGLVAILGDERAYRSAVQFNQEFRVVLSAVCSACQRH